MNDKLKRKYETNEDFREYVDKYVKAHNITVDEALTHRIIYVYAKELFNEKDL